MIKSKVLNSIKSLQLVPKTRVLLVSVFFIFFLFSPDYVFAQETLQAYARLRVRKGNTDGAQVVLYKNGSKVGTVPIGRGGRFDVNLDYEADYMLSFEKDNYVTKKININTKVPPDYQRRGAIIDFEVELEQQTDLSAIKVYDNPVGKIRYDAKIRDFDYDTDYSASFQQKLREEEKKIAEEVRVKEVEKEKSRVAQEAEQRRLEEETRKKAAEQARLAEQERVRKEAEARALADAKAREEAQKRIQEEKLKAEEEARRLADIEAARREEERKRIEEQRRAEAERTRLAEEARRKAEEQARLAEQERVRREAEARALTDAKAREEAQKRIQEERLKAEEDARRLADIEAARREEERKRIEEEIKKREEQSRKNAETENQRKVEERKLEEERIRNETLRIREQEEKIRLQLLEEQRRKKEEIDRQAEERRRSIISEPTVSKGKPIPVEDLSKKYGDETTIEKFQLNKIVLTRTVMNRNGVITFYTKVEHDNGAVYHFKNGEIITVWQYNSETQ